MEAQPQIADKDTPVRVQVLVQKITRWLDEHGEALVAAPMARLVIHIAGTNIRIHVEHIYERT